MSTTLLAVGAWATSADPASAPGQDRSPRPEPLQLPTAALRAPRVLPAALHELPPPIPVPSGELEEIRTPPRVATPGL